MVMEMSKTYQYRKVMKPLLERKRRARINKCLDDLKDLMVECLQQEGEHVTRLEKADILELTVEHMRKLKQRGALALQHGAAHAHAPPASAHVESFRSGYVHAADQISQVLLQQRQTDEVGCKIMKFLSTRLVDMQHQLLRTNSSSSAPLTKSQSQLAPTAAAASPPELDVLYKDAYCAEKTATSTGNTKDNNNNNNNSDTIVDVTTVDSGSWTDTASVISMDSCSSEPVWRPW